MHSFSQAEQAINNFSSIAQALAEISCVVPSAIDDNSFILVHTGPVTMTNAMNARNLHSASLGVKKIKRIPNRFFPNIRSYCKSMRTHSSCFENIVAILPYFRKIHHLEISNIRIDRKSVV